MKVHWIYNGALKEGTVVFSPVPTGFHVIGRNDIGNTFWDKTVSKEELRKFLVKIAQNNFDITEVIL